MREFGAGVWLREMRQCPPAGVESESELPLFSPPHPLQLLGQLSPKPISAILYTVVFVFFFVVVLTPHFPADINSVIMWGFIWLIKASSFWAISQRTWIKLPYLCTGATAGSGQAHAALCRLLRETGIDSWLFW